MQATGQRRRSPPGFFSPILQDSLKIYIFASRVEALLAGSELSSSRGINGGFDGSKYIQSFVELLIKEEPLETFEGSQYALVRSVSEYASVRQKGTYSGIWAKQEGLHHARRVI